MLTRYVAGRVYDYDYSIGRQALAEYGFWRPVDFAIGSARSLYVLNRGGEYLASRGVTKCTLDHELIWEDRGPEFAGGESLWPTSVALDRDEKVYVSDEHVNRVFVYDKDGNFQGSWGTSGSDDGQLKGPSGIAFDRKDNIYIVDSLNHRIQKFTKDGEHLGKWGRHGSGEGEFDMPWGIAVGDDGDVYVADWKNDRVQRFTSDGEYLATFGYSGTGDGELKRPSSVAVDDEGDVYVVDWGNWRLNIYAANGDFVTAFMGDADQLSVWGQWLVDANPDIAKARRRVDRTPEWRFRKPAAVNVDGDGRIMVLESMSARIQIYVKERDFAEAPLNL